MGSAVYKDMVRRSQDGEVLELFKVQVQASTQAYRDDMMVEFLEAYMEDDSCGCSDCNP